MFYELGVTEEMKLAPISAKGLTRFMRDKQKEAVELYDAKNGRFTPPQNLAAFEAM
jgi:hypothetical protein